MDRDSKFIQKLALVLNYVIQAVFRPTTVQSGKNGIFEANYAYAMRHCFAQENQLNQAKQQINGNLTIFFSLHILVKPQQKRQKM